MEYIGKDKELRKSENQLRAAKFYKIPVSKIRQARKIIDNIKQYVEDYGEYPSPVDVATDL